MNGDRNVTRRHLALAALLAGAGGLALVVLGWWIVDWQFRADWGRLSDGEWWASSVARALGFLAFGKVGFKVALVLLISMVAVGGWLRGRRRAAEGRDTAPAPGEQDGTAG